MYQQVHARERQLRLRLHARAPEHPHVRGPRYRVIEERRLADPRLAPDDQRAGAPVPRPREQQVDLRRLHVPPVHHCPHPGRASGM